MNKIEVVNEDTCAFKLNKTNNNKDATTTNANNSYEYMYILENTAEYGK